MVDEEGIGMSLKRNKSPNEKSGFCFDDLLPRGKRRPRTRILHLSFRRLPVQLYLGRKSNVHPLFLSDLFLLLLLLLPLLLLINPLLPRDDPRLYHRQVTGSTSTTTVLLSLPSQVWIWGGE